MIQGVVKESSCAWSHLQGQAEVKVLGTDEYSFFHKDEDVAQEE
jgi:hypothetical protein